MNTAHFLQKKLISELGCVDTGEAVAVPTHCLYPSNANVTVFVRGGVNEFTVSDDGLALAEISAHGFDIQKPTNILNKFCRPAGLGCADGQIYSPVVPLDGVVGAILHVANAASKFTNWAVHNLRREAEKDLENDIYKILRQQFSSARIKKEKMVSGESNRQYKFDFSVRLGGERILLVDHVVPNPVSINSRIVAHIDVFRLNEQIFLPRLVYDNEQPWGASDLAVLSMAGDVVPYSRFQESIASLSN